MSITPREVASTLGYKITSPVKLGVKAVLESMRIYVEKRRKTN